MKRINPYVECIDACADELQRLGSVLIHMKAINKAYLNLYKDPDGDNAKSIASEHLSRTEVYEKTIRQFVDKLPKLTIKSVDRLLRTWLPYPPDNTTHFDFTDDYDWNDKKRIDEIAWACFALRSIFIAFSLAIQKKDGKKIEKFSGKLVDITRTFAETNSLASVIWGHWYSEFEHKYKEQQRTMKSTEAMRAKKAKGMTEVLRAFHEAPNVDKISKPHTKSKELRKYLGKYKKPDDLPSVNTIKNYLREAGLI